MGLKIMVIPLIGEITFFIGNYLIVKFIEKEKQHATKVYEKIFKLCFTSHYF